MTKSMSKYYREVTGISTRNPLIDESIYNYLLYGIPPGRFTTALLENNLFVAASAADYHNSPNLSEIAKEVGRSIPLLAWGSPARVQLWMKDEDNRRADYRDRVEEAATMMKMQD